MFWKHRVLGWVLWRLVRRIVYMRLQAMWGKQLTRWFVYRSYFWWVLLKWVTPSTRLFACESAREINSGTRRKFGCNGWNACVHVSCCAYRISFLLTGAAALTLVRWLGSSKIVYGRTSLKKISSCSDFTFRCNLYAIWGRHFSRFNLIPPRVCIETSTRAETKRVQQK